MTTGTENGGRSGSDLYVGGRFTRIGDVEAHGIARFDGNGWFSLGDGPGWVIDMLIADEENIIVAGSFQDAEGTYGVSAWDGSSWTRLGDRAFGPDDARCLQRFNGTLVAGGSFVNRSTGLPYPVGMWLGGQWQPVGVIQGSAGSLAVFRDQLCASISGAVGEARLYKWDGSTWQAFTQGINGPVTALLPMGNSLLVAGSFTANEYVPCNAVARWDEPPTPIAVEDLSALPDPLGGVRISCRLAAATLVDMERIMVQRAPAEAGPFETISPGLLAGPDHGLTYWDRDGSPNRPAWYRFAVEHGSAVDFTRAVRVVDRVLLKDFGLRVVASSAGVEVRYRLPNDSSAHAVAVYDVAGRVVRMLASGVAGAGDHVALWNRTTTSGSPTARGVYFVRLESNGQHASARIVQPIR